MSTSFLGLPVSQIAVARGLTAALACLGMASGTNAVFNPASYASTFGFPQQSPAASEANSNPWVKIAGASRITGGLGLLAALYFRENRAVALMLMTGWLVAVNDGLQLRAEVAKIRSEAGLKSDAELESLKKAEGTSWGHMFFGPVAIGLGAWLYNIS